MLMPSRSFVRAIGLLLFAAATASLGAEAELTRYGPALFTPSPRTPDVTRAAFFGVPGGARLVVSLADGEAGAPPADATIELNGKRVWSARDARFVDGVAEVPVRLRETNALRVELGGGGGRALGVRIRQHAEMSLGLLGRIHFNINTNDYPRTREFYRRLGFAHAIGPFPETNTLAMSHSVGMSAPYRMYAELIYLGPDDVDGSKLEVPTGRFIDIIHWKEPANTQPAYARLDHLGIARVVLSTTNLDADMASLAATGAQFLSAPATRANGERFVIARDPAGTFVELMQAPGAQPVELNGSHVAAVHHLAINVSDFERSRAFYRLLGFTGGTPLPETESAEVARAMGFEAPFRRRAELMRHEADGSLIELSEWIEPRDLDPPHPAPINHPGLHRINYASSDPYADVERLRAQGVQFLSPVTPCCDGERSTIGIAVFADPDGTFLQLLGSIRGAR